MSAHKERAMDAGAAKNTPTPSPAKVTRTSDEKALSMLTDQLVECIHCGLCLESCPTYLEINREEDSPRGRIYLMRSVAEGNSALDESMLSHLDMCLGCRACETACPSDVQYGFLLENTRAQVERSRKRSFFERAGRKALLSVFTSPRLLAVSLFFATLPSRLLGRGPQAPGGMLTKLIGAHGAASSLRLSRFPPVSPVRLPEFTPARGERKMRVGMLEGCVMPVLFHDVNAATASVLSRLGCDVVVPEMQGCCGALHAHNGYKDQAAVMALRNMEAFEDAKCDVIAVNSAGCGSTMKEYHHLFEEGTIERARAERFVKKVKDISEVVDGLLPGAKMRELNITLTYHDACHLAHGQKVRSEPRRMLAAIPGLKMIPLAESDHCCGSAGVYSFTQPEMATTLQERKIKNIHATGAAVVATGNPGCQMWIASGLDASGSPVKALHPIQILDMALI